MFEAHGFSARVDFLERSGDGWDVVDVRSAMAVSSRSVKEHVPGLAYAVAVARAAGLAVRGSRLLMLAKAYRHGDPTESMFEPVDATCKVDARLGEPESSLDALAPVLTASDPPAPRLVSACRSCPFFADICLGAGHDHTVLELHRLHHTRLCKLADAGVVGLSDVPSEVLLSSVQQRIRRSALAGRLLLDPRLRDVLATFAYPVSYLDFETVSPAIPLYPGDGCRRETVTQYSLHVLSEPGAEPEHRAFLADAADKQERLLTEHLLDAAGSAGTVLVYSPYEFRVLRRLVQCFPDLASGLMALVARLLDLHGVVSGHVYHPAFAGSFSLKRVVSALLGEAAYDALALGNGQEAPALFESLAWGEAEDPAEARQALLDYCRMDTMVMVRLHRVLGDLARVAVGDDPPSVLAERHPHLDLVLPLLLADSES